MQAMTPRGGFWGAAARRAAPFLLALACVAMALWLAPQAQAKRGRPSPLLTGMNLTGIDDATPLATIDEELSVARSLHAKVVRVAMPWSQFEPNHAGQLDAHAVAAANRLMKDARAAHIEVIALVYQTPCWASTAPAALLAACRPGAEGHASAWPPADPSQLGSYVGWLARRYGDDLAAIEIWNEPDQINQDYLAGSEKPRHYAEMLKAAYPAIKHADPHVKVLAGSLVGSNGAFMEALYKEGIKGYYNGVAVHFYNLVLGSVRRFREVQLAHGDHTPLWLDEFGWSSCWPEHQIEQEQGCVTRRVQAQNIRTSFHELAQAHYVASLLTYGFKYVRDEQFGVFTAAGRRKPSFYALRTVLSDPFGKIPKVRLSLTRRGDQVVATGSAPVGDYMGLEAFIGGRLRYREIFTLGRFNTFSRRLPSVLGTSGITVRVFQYWAGRGLGAVSRI